MEKSAAMFFVVLLAAFTGTSIGAEMPSAKDPTIIKGLGESYPATVDLSVSRHFRVYVFKKEGVDYIQVNDLRGNVLVVVAKTGNSSSVLPIGSLGTNRIMLPGQTLAGQGEVTPMGTDGKCPCHAEVVYQEPNGYKIIVITDSNGNIIQVIVKQPNTPSPPPQQ